MNQKKIGFYLEESRFKYKYVNEELFRELEDALEEEKPTIIAKIMENNLSLIHYIIRKRYPNVQKICESIRVTYDDIFSAGCYGLLKSIYTFDVDKGYKFATYATMCIHNEFGMFMRKHKRSFTDVSIHKVTLGDNNGHGDITLLEMLVDDKDLIDEMVMGEFGFIVMEELERQLKPKELAILRAYVMDDDVTQSNVADRLGISQSYASRIINKTIKRAKNIYNKLGVV
jgi:RNA polymerase sporulation-specific sigma factor